MSIELIRAEFGMGAVNATDQPLHFVINELLSILDHGAGIPIDVALLITDAQKIVVTIAVE